MAVHVLFIALKVIAGIEYLLLQGLFLRRFMMPYMEKPEAAAMTIFSWYAPHVLATVCMLLYVRYKPTRTTSQLLPLALCGSALSGIAIGFDSIVCMSYWELWWKCTMYTSRMTTMEFHACDEWYTSLVMETVASTALYGFAMLYFLFFLGCWLCAFGYSSTMVRIGDGIVDVYRDTFSRPNNNFRLWYGHKIEIINKQE